MTLRSGMRQEIPELEVIEPLETIAATDPEQYAAYVCRGVASLLRGYRKEALVELEQAIDLAPDEWEPYFWKGMACAFLERDEESLAAIERSLELALPPILLTPLSWFEHDRPDFYQQYVMPLMARYNVV